MKKRMISTILVFLMFFSLCQGASAFAQEKIEPLTMEKAIKMAQQYDYKLKDLELNKKIGDIRTETSLENIGGSLNNPQVLQQIKVTENDKINSGSYQREKDLTELLLRTNIQSFFSNIELMSEDIILLKSKISAQENKLKISELKHQLGLNSQVDLNISQNDMKTMRIDLEKLNKDLDNNKKGLSRLIGLGEDTNYEIQPIELPYHPLKENDQDLDLRITRAMSSDVTLWGLQQKSKMADIDVDLYAMNVINGLQSDEQPSRENYTVLTLQQQQSSNSIQEQKDKVRANVTDKYFKIKGMERDYESTQLKLQLLNNQINVMETSLKVGMVAKQDLDDLKINKKELELSIRKIEAGHSMLIENYQSPMLSGTPQ